MGFFQDLFGGGGANVSSLQKKQQSLIDRGTALYDSLLSNAQEADRAGAWDPNAQLDLLGQDTAHATKIQSGNAVAAARGLGNRPGDSEPILAQRAISDAATLNYDQMANAIRTNALKGRLDAYNNLAAAGGSLLGQGINAYNDQIQQGLAQQQQSTGLFGTVLGAAMPFLNPVRSAAKVATAAAPASSTPIYYGDPYRPGGFVRKS